MWEWIGLAIVGSVLAWVAMADWAEMRERMAAYRRRARPRPAARYRLS